MAEAPVIAPDTNTALSDAPSADLTPSYDLASHRNALRAVRGLEPLAGDKPAPVTEPVTANEPYQPPAYSAESHRASLAAMRGQLAPGMPYVEPALVPEVRTADQLAWDERYGAPASGRYDVLDLGADAPAVAAALSDMNFTASGGRSLVDSVQTASREYQSLDDAGKAAWSARQNQYLAQMPNSAEILADAKNGMALFKQTAPAVAAKLMMPDGTVPFMTAVMLHLWFQTQVSRPKSAKAAS